MSDEKRTWYQRTHQFTPYTKADGTAVSDEFDAIQASFERIPAMRDDGKGFATSPLIPEPSDPNHPVPFKMLTETEASVNNARDDVTKKAQQVAHNAQSVATNTQTTINQAKSASQSAESASASSRSASNSEEMARKWASNPENEVVLDEKYSAYHYAQKAAQLAVNLASAESSATQSATIATQKAEEATQAAKKAESLASGEIDYAKVLNVPHSNINTEGVVRLTNDTGLDDENLALTAKAGKELAEQISQLQQNVTKNYIPNDKKSSAVDSNSEENVANSAAVKTAYDLANSKQSPATTLAGYGIGNFKIEPFVGNLNTLKTDGVYAITQASRSQNLPVSTSCHIQVIAGGDGAWCRQLAYIAYSTDVYERHQTSYQTDSWSAWARIDVRDEFNALKDIFIGVPIPYPLSTVPIGCLAMNGQRFDTRRYPKLAQKYPSGQLPDMRGEFIRGWDNGRDVDTGRALLSAQGDAIRNITGEISDFMYESKYVFNSTHAFKGAFYKDLSVKDLAITVNPSDTNQFGDRVKFDASRVVPTASDNRPRNIAYHYICLAE